MKRSLKPASLKLMPQVLMCRTDVPSFRKALDSDVVGAIAEAKTDLQSVQQCLRSYGSAQGLPLGILDHFEYKVPKFGLFPSVVWLYTVDDWVYKRVNNALRAEEDFVIAQLAPYIAALGAACQTLDSDFSAIGRPPQTLYRRIPLHTPELKKYQVGETFVWNSFTSTSCFPPSEGAFGGGTLFEIEFNQTALGATLFVEPFTNQPSEYEVIIPVGAFFKVVERKEGGASASTGTVIRLKMLGATNLFHA
eukprot:TRINITY_DN66747_c1_g1_i1.p1 TRINITY_DN66747_c1_g1~~TRINITY_DN66747_c1_g1_i1.p1  ORF type:complete len:290 (-),score=46.73 TRINITY_DN66747_c1_g1_i1:44-793(-)